MWFHLDTALGNPPVLPDPSGKPPAPSLLSQVLRGTPIAQDAAHVFPTRLGIKGNRLSRYKQQDLCHLMQFISREMIAEETLSTERLQKNRTYLRAPRRCWRPWWAEQPGSLRDSQEHTGTERREKEEELFQTPKSLVPAGSLPHHVPQQEPPDQYTRNWATRHPSRVLQRGFLTKTFWLVAACCTVPSPCGLPSLPAPGVSPAAAVTHV